jgi:hypothetical protein
MHMDIPARIDVLPLRVPEYTLTEGLTFEAWLAENEEALRRWYAACSAADPDESIVDFIDFANSQFERKRDFEEMWPSDDEFEALLAESDADDTPYEDAP